MKTMKKKIVGRAKTRVFKNVYQKADKAIAELEARGFTIVEVQGKDGGVLTQTFTTTLINLVRAMIGKKEIKDVVITIYYK